MSLAQNWRRRGIFDEVAFIFPNAPMIPITVVSWDNPCVIQLSTESINCFGKLELRNDHARMARLDEAWSRGEIVLA